MRNKLGLWFGLLGLMAAGILPLVLAPHHFGLPTTGAVRVYSLWASSLFSFAIPFSLLVLSFTRSAFGLLCCLAWGLWIAALSLLLVARATLWVPEITFYGTVLLIVTGLMASMVVLFSLFGLTPSRKRAVPRTTPPVNSEATPSR